MIGAVLGVTLIVIALADPGTSAAGATVRVHGDTRAPAGDAVERDGTIGPDGRAAFDLAPAPYVVRITKTGFIPAERRVTLDAGRGPLVVRIPFHAVQSAALRTIGAVAATDRGAFNRAPEPLSVLPREGYRDQGQPGSATVFTQTPGIAVDRAGRGALAIDDAQPVALVRGGVPMETQLLLEGVPIALPSTRTLALSAIPAFVVSELEVHPGQAAPLPTIDGGLNGSLNIRFAEPTPVWRALPEVGADARGGSFADISAGGVLANRRIGIALAATSNGAKAEGASYDVIQRAALLKARAALSPAAAFTATAYDEADHSRFNAGTFSFTEGELRVNAARDFVLARWWHAGAARRGPAPGAPLEFRTDDSLTGGSLEVDRLAHDDTFAAGVSETYGHASALGQIDVDPGAHNRVQTAFLRALVHPVQHVETQLTVYGVRADVAANARALTERGVAARVGVAFRPSSDFTVRGSLGAGFTPPPLVALAAIGALAGVTSATGADVGFDRRIIDRETTLSFDVFASTAQNRLEQDVRGRWIDAGTVARRGAELSIARRPRAGLGYLLQAWTASETPSLATSNRKRHRLRGVARLRRDLVSRGARLPGFARRDVLGHRWIARPTGDDAAQHERRDPGRRARQGAVFHRKPERRGAGGAYRGVAGARNTERFCARPSHRSLAVAPLVRSDRHRWVSPHSARGARDEDVVIRERRSLLDRE